MFFIISLVVVNQLHGQIIFPKASRIVDITLPPYEADNNGEIDATSAIQQAINDYTPGGWHIIYFPKGTYLVSNTIEWSRNSWSQGPVFQGYHMDSTIIQLKDECEGFTDPAAPKSVLWTGDGVAQKFDRGIRDLTVNTGTGNSGAIGIQFYSNNEGLISDVKIISGDRAGVIGLHMAYGSENGPLLVRNLYIEGFDTGIKTNALNSITLSNVELYNQKVIGLYNNAHVVNIENLMSTNTVMAVKNNSGTSTMTIINSNFNGGDPGTVAMENLGNMFARNIVATGYEKVLDFAGASETWDEKMTIEEYASHGVQHLFASPAKSLNLQIKQTPVFEWTTDTSLWVNVNDYGAVPDDNIDDSEAIQNAIDAGKPVVYIPRNGMYDIQGTIYLRGKVKHFLGTNAWFQGTGKIIVDEGDEPVVMIERMRRRNPNVTVAVENQSSRTLIIESCIFGTYRAIGSGEIYLNDVLGRVEMTNPQARIWSRHHNTEKPGDTNFNIKNDGATLWILGLKTESYGLKSWVLNGGSTEILGAHVYPQCTEKTTPMFKVENAKFSGAGIRETNYCNKETPRYYLEYIEETQNNITRVFSHDDAPAIGGGNGRGYSLYTSHVDGLEYPGNIDTLKAETIGSDRIRLSWEQVTGSTLGYYLERKFGTYWIMIDTIPETTSSYVDEGLSENTIYSYRLQAYNANGITAFSNIATDTTFIQNDIDLEKNVTVNIFPVPAKNILTIELNSSSTGLENIKVFSLDGRIQLVQEIRNPVETIELASFDEGMYILQLTGSEKMIRRIIVVKK